MIVAEAKEWVAGRRSHTNIMQSMGCDPVTRYALIEVADAASMVQAVMTLAAHKHGLLSVDDPDNPPPF